MHSLNPQKETADLLGLAATKRHGHVDVITVLLDRGAKLETKDIKGLTVLMQAVSNNNTVDATKLLLDRGAELEAKDKIGETALHPIYHYSWRYVVQPLRALDLARS